MTKRYKQTEDYYKTLMMGFGSGSVYDFGCYLVSLVNGLSERGYTYTPRTFNQLLKDLGAWIGEYKNYIDVDRLDNILPDIFESYKRIEPCPDMSTIKWYLDRDYIIVAKVNAKAIGGSGSHFVYVEYIKDGVAWIYDPFHGDLRKVTDRYGNLGNLLGLRIFKVKRLSDSSTNTQESGTMEVKNEVFEDLVTKATERDEIKKLVGEPVLQKVEDLKNEVEKTHSELRQEVANRVEQVSKLDERLRISENEKKELDIKLIDALTNVKYVEVPSADLVNKITSMESSLVEERKARDEADKAKGRALNEVARLKDLYAELEKKNSNLLKKRSTTLPATQVLSALWSALWARLKGVEVEV